ncbi:oncoprotein-induced transcript 3 protein-like [Argopecten irradians]|uniref:oncoprotein-induced transcript 3 protein-like n=1 Tax=Argopecten irradians TaxID=31199 RepID=UPI0037118CFD
MGILIIVLVICKALCAVTTDPCLSYTSFAADSERAPSHTESVYEKKNCDAVLSTKWYRLVGDAGSDLTNNNSVLVDNGCGTSHQLWMNGTVPDVSDGIVNREMCMRSIFSPCHGSFNIRVKNCCSFRVYELKSATNCPQAYCVSPSTISSVTCASTTTATPTTTTTTAAPTITTTTPPTTTTTTPGTPVVTTKSTTVKSTTTTPETTSTSVIQDSGNNQVTIVKPVSSEVIITVIVLLVIIATAVLGIFLYKTYKCSKVDADRNNTYDVPAQRYHNQNEHVYADLCVPTVAVEKGGAPVHTHHI